MTNNARCQGGRRLAVWRRLRARNTTATTPAVSPTASSPRSVNGAEAPVLQTEPASARSHRPICRKRSPRAAPDSIAGLRERGHDVVVQDVAPGELAFSRVSAVAIDGEKLTAGAGPAWNTAAGGLE